LLRQRTCGPSRTRPLCHHRLAVTFLTVFVVLPLVVVFTSAFFERHQRLFFCARRAGGAVGDQADLLVAAISVTLTRVGVIAPGRSTKFDFRGKTFLITLIRPAVLASARSFRASSSCPVRRAGLLGHVAAGA